MEDHNNCVYKHTSPSGKVYIGITCLNPSYRWSNGNGYATQPAMANAIKKYGWDSFTHEIVYDNLTREEAAEREKELIALYRSNDPSFGYNCTSGGDAKFFVSSETRHKQSEAKKRFLSEHPEYLEQMRQRVIGSYADKALRVKIGNSIKIIWKDPEYRARMSKALSFAGKKHYAEHPERAIAAQKRSLERWSDPFFREKMRVSMKGIQPTRYAIQRSIEARQTPVLCIEENRVFNSLDDAASFVCVRKSCIRDCCLGVQETSGGYHWRYANETDEDWHKRRNAYYVETGVSQTSCIVRGEDGVIFNNAHEASRSVEGDSSSIIKCCRGKQKTAYGYHWSYLVDEQLSALEKANKYTVDTTHPRKSVLCVERGFVFPSVSCAALWVNNAAGGTYQSILKCCRGQRKTACGYHWEYVD